MPRLIRGASLAGALLAALAPAVAFAHGGIQPAPTFPSVLLRWTFDPFLLAALVLSAWAYWSGLRRVARLHPKSPFPRRRAVAFFAGLGAVVIALFSPLATYDTQLFSVHMWQHMVLVLIAAPLLLMGTPITLGLRAASPALRKRVLLPLLHSRALKVLTFPVLAWLVFTATMWATHFLPLYDAALENEWLHRLEHLWFIAAALLFWWQVIGLDPTPWRMGHPMRILYLFLQMPQNSFLALAIYNSSSPIYDHYETLERTWGPSPLLDQQLAGITMWVFGDLFFLAALGFVAYGWVKAEERKAKREDRLQERAERERLQPGGVP